MRRVDRSRRSRSAGPRFVGCSGDAGWLIRRVPCAIARTTDPVRERRTKPLGAPPSLSWPPVRPFIVAPAAIGGSGPSDINANKFGISSWCPHVRERRRKSPAGAGQVLITMGEGPALATSLDFHGSRSVEIQARNELEAAAFHDRESCQADNGNVRGMPVLRTMMNHQKARRRRGRGRCAATCP
jgi:hypothetical protein